jgi:hypothetical protein
MLFRHYAQQLLLRVAANVGASVALIEEQKTLIAAP